MLTTYWLYTAYIYIYLYRFDLSVLLPDPALKYNWPVLSYSKLIADIEKKGKNKSKTSWFHLLSHILLKPSFPVQCGENWHSYFLLALFRTALSQLLSLGCDIFSFRSLQIYRRQWLLSRPLYKYISSQLLRPPASSGFRLCVSSSHRSCRCRSGTQTCDCKPVINLCYRLPMAAYDWHFRSPDLWAWWLLKNIKTQGMVFSHVLCVSDVCDSVFLWQNIRMGWSARARFSVESLWMWTQGSSMKLEWCRPDIQKIKVWCSYQNLSFFWQCVILRF